MAQEFSRKFYKSKEWQKCRYSYIASVHGLCERCSSLGMIKTGYILHHKIRLSPRNIDDPNITLNHKYLKYVCKDCHEIEHHGVRDIIREGFEFNELGEMVRVCPP